MEIEATFSSGLGSEWDVAGSYFISVSATPEDLQTLVLQILGKNANLGFLLNNMPILTTLEDQLNKQQISTESKIKIEFYIEIPPLKSESESQAEDWVSCVKIYNGAVYSGDYAGVIMTHGAEKNTKQALKGPIKSFSFHDNGILVAGLKGEVVLLDTNFEVLGTGNTDRLEQIAWSVSGSAFAVGGSTGKLQMGNISESTLQKGLKKQKISADTLNIQPLTSYHTDKVTGLYWPSLETLLSCSWDHSITFTDLEKMTVENSILCNRAVQCMKYEGNLILAGFENGGINGYDSRSKGKILSFVYGEWVRAISIVGNAVVAGGENGELKIFDMRAGSAARNSIEAHEGKVMAIDSIDTMIVSGGSDGKVRIFNFIE